MFSGSGLPRASSPFERQNTQLPDEMSPSPYFKTSSYQHLGGCLIRMMTAPPVTHLIFRF